MNKNNIFFTADTHLNHTNIIRFTNRPFVDLGDMNAEIIKNWNSVVTNDDTVFHLGDVLFGNGTEALEILNRLNGTIYLIKGNHEKTVMSNKALRDRFHSIHDLFELKVDDNDTVYSSGKGHQLIILCHYAFEVWKNSHYGSWHLHGHSHNGLPTPENMLRMDAGVDNPICDFFPLSYNQVKKHMETKKFIPINKKD